MLDKNLSLKQIVEEALDPSIPGNKQFNIVKTQFFLENLKDRIGQNLYNKIITKYQIQHINQQSININIVRALLVGISTNLSADDLHNNDKLQSFLAENRSKISKMAQVKRKDLAHNMDKITLQQTHPVIGFFLRVGKSITDIAVKKNDLKDAFAGVQIHKAFEEDIKIVATIEYAKTYQSDYKENNIAKGISSDEIQKVIPNETSRKKISSGLYLASDLAYRNFNNGSVIPVLDNDGTEHLYRVHNIVNDKGLVCTALMPYHPQPNTNLEVKILFRGTFSGASAIVDLETTGAGSKTMRDNRIQLLDEVNKILSDLQTSQPSCKVGLSLHGHSLGGSFAERFTSEIHQAIYFNNNQTPSDTDIKDAVRAQNLLQGNNEQNETKLVNDLQNRILKNNREMKGKDYSALNRLTHVTTTSANSARLSSLEARVGEGFIALNQKLPSAPKQTLNYFKAGGDWVSQAGMKSLGSGFGPESTVEVTLLKKQTEYGISNIHPILGHCDHPLMRYHDTDNKKAPIFDYYSNSVNQQALLQAGLTSGKALPKLAQKFYGKTPQMVAEPLTWAKKQHAKIKGEDPSQVKGFKIKTESEKNKPRNNKKKL